MNSPPVQGPEVGKDLVTLVLHLAVDAADSDLLDEHLQGVAVVLHRRTRAEKTETRKWKGVKMAALVQS